MSLLPVKKTPTTFIYFQLVSQAPLYVEKKDVNSTFTGLHGEGYTAGDFGRKKLIKDLAMQGHEKSSHQAI